MEGKVKQRFGTDIYLNFKENNMTITLRTQCSWNNEL